MSTSSIYNMLIFNILFLSFINIVISQQSPFVIKEIFPYYMNVTGAYLSLDNLNIKKYVYFSFDFSNEKDRNYACFKISTDSVLYQSRIKYLFFEKEIDEISNNDINKNDVLWYYIKGQNYRKEKTEQGFDSYIKIEKFSFIKGKTLVMQIDVEKLNGDIIVENLESIPEISSLNKNIYKENYSQHHDKDHNHIINNEQRYYNQDYNKDYNKDIHNRYNHYHKEWRYHSHEINYETSPIRIVYGTITAQIWLVLLVAYCLVNRRKTNIQYNVAINNNV